MVARKRSDNHHEEAHMSRIATLTAVLTMLVAPTAFAGPADLRSPDTVTPVRITAPSQDLRSPDAIDVFRPSAPAPHAASTNDGSRSPWAFLAIVAAALAACVALAVMLRRHLIGPPLGV
jgi:hypothetical protein